MDAGLELHMILGTSLSDAYNKCMAFVIMYSSITLDCVRYS